MSRERREKREQKRQERIRQELENQVRLYQATRPKPLAQGIAQALREKAAKED